MAFATTDQPARELPQPALVGLSFSRRGNAVEIFASWWLGGGFKCVYESRSNASAFLSCPIYESECYQCTAQVGVPAGIANSWYLGYGFSAELGAFIMPMRARFAINWVISEDLRLAIRLESSDFAVGALLGTW
jgi:hypothetical protein